MADTRVRIDITTGTIELEGSESFVTKYLEEFKALLPSAIPSAPKSLRSTKTTRPRKETTSKESGDTDDETKKPKSKRKSAGKISPERFEIHGGNDKPSLQEFFDEKNPGKANGDVIAVIGYYITEILGNDTFTEGQIEYAYRMLKLKRPGHLHQVMINNKNEKDYYQPDEGETPGVWTMTRGGEIFVGDNLPPSSE